MRLSVPPETRRNGENDGPPWAKSSISLRSEAIVIAS